MNPRTTGILLLLALALGSFVYLYEIRGGRERQAAEEAAKHLFPGVEGDAVAWIELETSDDREARLERADEGWRLTRPLVFPADSVTADAMASSLADLESKAVYENPQPPEVYELGDKAHTVRFGVGDEVHELRIGKKTPVGADTYVAVAGDKRVFSVESFRVSGFTRKLDDLRERRPLRFDREAIRRIEASWPDGRVVLDRDEEGWRLREPLDERADSTAVESLLSELTFLRAAGFEDDPPPDAEAGLDRPAFHVVLVGKAPEGGGEPPRFELTLGSVPQESGVLLARAAEPTLYRIPKQRLDNLPRSLVAYRFKDLTRFAVSDAERLELVFPDPEAQAQGRSGEVIVVAEHGEEGWTSSPERLAPGKAARIVSELATLRAKDIVADSLSEAERAKLGLAPPHAVVRIFGAPAEEGDEAPRLAELRLGEADHEQGIAAQVPERETVYRVDYSLAEHVPVSLEALRNRFLSKESPPSPPAAEPEPAGTGGAE